MYYCYKVEPLNEIRILRKCSGCGCQKPFINTRRFRVNANGSLLDIWLIYQCEKCKHTYNLPLRMKVRADEMDAALYRRFLENDEELAIQLGKDSELFRQRNVRTDLTDAGYRLKGIPGIGNESLIVIENPDGLKIRDDKLLAELLGISRGQAMKLLREKMVVVEGNRREKRFRWEKKNYLSSIFENVLK